MDRAKLVAKRGRKKKQEEVSGSQAPNNGLDPDQIWNELKEGVEHIYAEGAERKCLSHERVMKLYSNVYNFCTRVVESDCRKSQGLKAVQTVTNRGNLYPFLVQFLMSRVDKIYKERPEGVEASEILNYYHNQCNEYFFSSKVINSIFSYFNRLWVTPNDSLGIPKNIQGTYDVAIHCWKVFMFDNLSQSLGDGIVALLEKDRVGETVQGMNIRTVLNSFIEMGGIGTSDSKDALTLYVDNFQVKFLASTTMFYEIESQKLIDELPMQVFMKKVEKIIHEEEDRAQKYLHSSTLKPLIKICEETLIQTHFEKFQENLLPILTENKLDDLGRLYSLVRRLGNEYLVELSNLFESFMSNSGLKSLGEIPPENNEDVIFIFDTLYGIYHKFDEIVSGVLHGDMNFRRALDKAFTTILKQGNFDSFAHGNSSGVAFLLAKYADRLLRKSSQRKLCGEDELETKLTNLVRIFRYLQDKDVFEKQFCASLASRLLTGSIISAEAEGSMISKLKISNGHEYVSKMQRMLQDVNNSNITVDQFKSKVKELPYDFYIFILTTGTWNYCLQNSTFNLPQELNVAHKEFTNFYKDLHKGRVLQWLTGRSYGEVKYVPDSKRATYTLNVSTYQMSILLLFNNVDLMTVDEMMEETKLEYDILLQVLELLLKCKILVKDSANEPLSPTSKIKLFLAYNNKKLKLNINVPLKYDEKRDEEKVNAEVEKSRNYIIQAQIVRIMKTRKSMRHQNLIGEVMSSVKNLFTPEVRVIRNAIEKLIEGEYISRSEVEKDVYDYVA